MSRGSVSWLLTVGPIWLPLIGNSGLGVVGHVAHPGFESTPRCKEELAALINAGSLKSYLGSNSDLGLAGAQSCVESPCSLRSTQDDGNDEGCDIRNHSFRGTLDSHTRDP